MPAKKTTPSRGTSVVSEIWQYLTRRSATQVRCNLCAKRFQASSSSTKQYWSHLRYHHGDVFDTTQYCKDGLATNRNRIHKRVRRVSAQTGTGRAASEVLDVQVALEANARDDDTNDIGNEQVLVANSVQPEAATAPDAELTSEPTDFPFTADQRKLLEEWFQRIHSHWTQEQECLAEEFGVDEQTIRSWFHHRMGQEAHDSLPSDLNDDGSTVNEVDDHPTDPVDRAQDSEMAKAAGNEEEISAPRAVDQRDAAIPDASIEHEPVLAPHALLDMMHRLRARQLQQSLFQPPHFPAAPQPLPMPVPQVPVVDNSLVETSGRAIILRLRQLYAKDAKLFLRAQNDINNVIFQFEEEHL